MPPFSKNLAEEGVVIRNFKVVDQGHAKIDELSDTGALRIIVRLSIMAAAATSPQSFEIVDDLVNAVVEQTGKAQETESIENT